MSPTSQLYALSSPNYYQFNCWCCSTINFFSLQKSQFFRLDYYKYSLVCYLFELQQQKQQQQPHILHNQVFHLKKLFNTQLDNHNQLVAQQFIFYQVKKLFDIQSDNRKHIDYLFYTTVHYLVISFLFSQLLNEQKTFDILL